MAVREFRYIGSSQFTLDDGSKVDPGQYTGPIDDTTPLNSAAVAAQTLLPVASGTFAAVYGAGGNASRVLPSQIGGGVELAYAEITANFTTASVAGVDVPGLSITFTPTGRPVMIKAGCRSLQNGTAAGGAVMQMFDANNNPGYGILDYISNPAGDRRTAANERRITPPAGVPLTVKAKLIAISGTAIIVADVNQPAWLQAVSV